MSTQKLLVNEAKINLKTARMEAGLTQFELGKRIGKSRLWVNFRENEAEGRNLYLNDLIEWAKITGKPLCWFFHLRGERSEVLEKLQDMKNLLNEIEKFCLGMMEEG